MSATNRSDAAVVTLKAFAFRLSSTPAANLPSLLPHIAAQIGPCKELLRTPQPSHSETAAFIHQIRTRTSSLLQDRTPEARLTAVVLVKVLVETGGFEILANNGGSWVRGLIAMVARQDSTSNATRKLAIVAVTRIIGLAKEHETLAREIATPNLPPFVTACLTVLESAKDQWGSRQRDLLDTVLRSWAQLIPRHSATFRPFIGRIITILSRIIEIPRENADQERKSYIWNSEVKEAARTVYVQLHNSATKTGSLGDRDSGCVEAITSASHAIRETFTAIFGYDNLHNRHVIPQNGHIISSAEDLWEHLQFVRTYVTTASSKPVSVAIGKVTLIIQAVSSSPNARLSDGNVTIGKREREQFLIDLPRVHLAALDLIKALTIRFGMSISSVSIQLMDAVINIYQAHNENSILRCACYHAITYLLVLFGPGLTRAQCIQLTPIIQDCCRDLLSATELESFLSQPSSKTNMSSSKTPTLTSASVISTQLRTSQPILASFARYPPLCVAAISLHVILLRHLSPNALKPPIRAELDRVAIITQNADALVASTMKFPTRSGQSIITFAARCGAARDGLEGLLRPRIPVVLHGGLMVEEKDEDRAEESTNLNDWYRKSNTIGGESMEIVQDDKQGPNQDVVEETSPFNTGNLPVQNQHAGRTAFDELKRAQHSESASKHFLNEEEDQVSGIVSPTKRARYENESAAPIFANEDKTLPTKEQEKGRVQTMAQDLESKPDGSDEEDDGSDFEVPQLVLTTEDDN
jgi:pre-rRNA-processing protein RIX1